MVDLYYFFILINKCKICISEFERFHGLVQFQGHRYETKITNNKTKQNGRIVHIFSGALHLANLGLSIFILSTYWMVKVNLAAIITPSDVCQLKQLTCTHRSICSRDRSTNFRCFDVISKLLEIITH